MKINANTTDLYKALKKVGGCINTGHNVTILQCVKFEFTDGFLTLTATDLEITSSTRIKMDAQESFSTCLEYVALANILKNCASQPMTIAFDKKTATITVAEASYKLPMEEPKAFPEIVKDEVKVHIKIGEKVDFLGVLKEAAPFCANDELQPKMSNISVVAKNGVLRVIGPSGDHIYQNALENTNGEFGIIIPKAAIGYLSTEPISKEDLSVSFSEKNLYLSDEDTTVYVRLIDLNPPVVDGAIPKEPGTTVFEFDKLQLMQRLNRIAVVCNNMNFDTLRVDIKSNEMVITAENEAFNQEGREILPGTLTGNPIAIGMSLGILKRIMQPIPEGSIKINLTHPDKALYIFSDKKTVLAAPRMLPKS